MHLILILQGGLQQEGGRLQLRDALLPPVRGQAAAGPPEPGGGRTGRRRDRAEAVLGGGEVRGDESTP